MAATPQFRLRFPIEAVGDWVPAYDYGGPTGERREAEVIEIGRRARLRGWYNGDEFCKVAYWKTPRTRPLIRSNVEAAVVETTGVALTTSDERERIGALMRLRGVGMPTASVFLHLGHRDPYPILDVRALWSAGLDDPARRYPYSFGLWSAYTAACRSWAAQVGVDMRTLDRALWGYSAAMQGRR